MTLKSKKTSVPKDTFSEILGLWKKSFAEVAGERSNSEDDDYWDDEEDGPEYLNDELDKGILKRVFSQVEEKCKKGALSEQKKINKKSGKTKKNTENRIKVDQGVQIKLDILSMVHSAAKEVLKRGMEDSDGWWPVDSLNLLTFSDEVKDLAQEKYKKQTAKGQPVAALSPTI